MLKEIQITVNPDGTTKTDFSGFAGPSCLDAAQRLRELLAQFGIQSEETQFTPKPELEAPLENNQVAYRQAEQGRS
jgi:acetylornithine deacetylase/succinyl-diaminopimelate desuccinylase-like protein